MEGEWEVKKKNRVFRPGYLPLGEGKGSIIEITLIRRKKKIFQTDQFKIPFLGEADTTVRLDTIN